MSASPVVISQKPLFLNADTGVHTAAQLRRQIEPLAGVGALDLNSWRVRQRVAGAAMSVDVTDAATVSKAFVRGSSVAEQGTYLVANVNQTTSVIDAIYNVDIAAADGTNPRIDQVFLCVEDAQHAGANNQATVRVVTGTATGGATLDNRTGVGAVPAGMSSILLADILVAAAVGSILTAAIRDRRPVALFGTLPWTGAIGTQIDAVSFQFHPTVKLGEEGSALGQSAVQGTTDLFQSAVAAWLPRRIVGATRLRWRYRQGATAVATNYVLFVADASGRIIAATAATAFTGALNTYNEVSIALLATTTFEAGWYYIGIGIATMTAGSSLLYTGAITLSSATSNNGTGAAVRNTIYRSATGGSVAPTTIAAFSDVVATTVNAAGIPVPPLTLSVT